MVEIVFYNKKYFILVILVEVFKEDMFIINYIIMLVFIDEF